MAEKETSEAEIFKRSDATLKRLLATPPKPQTKKKKGAKPKKRGRPRKENPATKPGSPR